MLGAGKYRVVVKMGSGKRVCGKRGCGKNAVVCERKGCVNNGWYKVGGCGKL